MRVSFSAKTRQVQYPGLALKPQIESISMSVPQKASRAVCHADTPHAAQLRQIHIRVIRIFERGIPEVQHAGALQIVRGVIAVPIARYK